MRQSVTIKKGLDLKLQGAPAAGEPVRSVTPRVVAIIPDDFPGLAPKPEVKAGDIVKAGTPLLRDKADEAVKLVSPVAGRVREIVRGARRHIERVEIEVEGSESLTYPRPADAQQLRSLLKESGLWAMMRQRPYDIIPQAEAVPRDIFVTAFDSAPLALPGLPERSVRMLAEGVKALASLTTGHVYVAVPAGSSLTIEGAVMVDVKGPHPAGTAGPVISALAPVCKGETVWTLTADTLERIGQLLTEGRYSFEHRVAVTGPEVLTPCTVTALPGTPMQDILRDNLRDTTRRLRVISGNVLTGINAGLDGWLHWPYSQVTVILDGSDADEFMGWASLSPSKMSLSRTFASWLMPRKRFAPDARLLGGRRAMIMSGIYESLIPMDIMPEFLIKAILSRNIEEMEALGIYEVAPEDFALAEWADPSKLELQKIVREGLDYLRKEL